MILTKLEALYIEIGKSESNIDDILGRRAALLLRISETSESNRPGVMMRIKDLDEELEIARAHHSRELAALKRL